MPNIGRAFSSVGGGEGRLDSPIKLVILLGAQLLLIVVWLLRLAIHHLLLLASFLRFSLRLYVELRNDNVARDMIPSADTDTTPADAGAPDVRVHAMPPTPLRVLSVHERTHHHAQLT